jgi:AraC-like DNA-binding protein
LVAACVAAVVVLLVGVLALIPGGINDFDQLGFAGRDSMVMGWTRSWFGPAQYRSVVLSGVTAATVNTVPNHLRTPGTPSPAECSSAHSQGAQYRVVSANRPSMILSGRSLAHMMITSYRACPERTWELADAVPDRRLRPGVRSYRGYRLDLGKPRRRLEVPDGVVTLVLNFDHHLRVSNAVNDSAPSGVFSSLVAGPHTHASVGDHDGRLHGIEVILAPWAAFTLFATPMDQLVNTMTTPDDLLGSRARDIAGAVAATLGWAERFTALDAILTRYWDAGPVCSPRVVWAWHLLARTGGRIPIRQLAARTGWSQQHLERRFREQVGLLPKAAARVLRFQRALRLLTHGLPAAGAATACGFADQAHLSREFATMTGSTVARFLNDRGVTHNGPPSADRVHGQVTSVVLPAPRDVDFLQDTDTTTAAP